MDLGAHNATLELLSYRRRLSRFRYFIFLNSSVKGPFAPPWTPPGWHWTHAYLARFEGDVHAVGSSLVCLPPADAGGPGPRLESWAFALDGAGLAAALEAGVFVTRGCKLCADGGDGIVVGGEYGLTKAQLAAGHNVAALMARYARGTDWRDERHWGCNDNAHPSRQGTYAGISQHPFETVRALCGAVCVVAVLWLDVFPVCCRPVLACCCSVCASQSLPLSPPHATPRRTTHLTHMPQHTHTHTILIIRSSSRRAGTSPTSTRAATATGRCSTCSAAPAPTARTTRACTATPCPRRRRRRATSRRRTAPTQRSAAVAAMAVVACIGRVGAFFVARLDCERADQVI